jgi:hypothetical protein
MKTPIPITEANLQYKEAVKALIEEYGDASHIPKELLFLIGEEARFHYCVDTQSTWTLTEVVRHYSIDKRVAALFIGEDKATSAPERKQKRSDKYSAIFNYVDEHVFEQVTPAQIAEIGSVSHSTALKVIESRPDIFRKIKRGLYELRDAQADRKAQK